MTEIRNSVVFGWALAALLEDGNGLRRCIANAPWTHIQVCQQIVKVRLRETRR
jgi:hypothetical protein